MISAVSAVSNPLSAQGGIDPQPMAEAKLFAPHAFRNQLQRAGHRRRLCPARQTQRQCARRHRSRCLMAVGTPPRSPSTRVTRPGMGKHSLPQLPKISNPTGASATIWWLTGCGSLAKRAGLVSVASDRSQALGACQMLMDWHKQCGAFFMEKNCGGGLQTEQAGGLLSSLRVRRISDFQPLRKRANESGLSGTIARRDHRRLCSIR